MKSIIIKDLIDDFMKGKLEPDIYSGFNEDKEVVFVIISKDKLVFITSQKNNFIRFNVIHKDGTKEEYYE